MIDVQALTKSYGKRVAVDAVSFDVSPGEIFAVVGGHCAGKSTLVRMLATLLRPTSGDALIGGVSVVRQPEDVRPYIGYLPDDFGVYSDMTAGEYLSFFAECYGMAAAERAGLTADLLQLVDLTRQRDMQLEALTHGMKQRLGIARMLVNDPSVLLLDEPMHGLDPRAHVESRELLRELVGMDKCIVLTGRSVAAVAGLAHRAAVLQAGKVTAIGPLDELIRAEALRRVIGVRFIGDAERAVGIARDCEGVLDVEVIGASVIGQPLGAPAESGPESRLDPAQLVALSQLASASSVQSLMKDMRCGFAGSYEQANDLLSRLLRGGVQVVAFGEV